VFAVIVGLVSGPQPTALDQVHFRISRSFGAERQTWGASLVDWDRDGRSDPFLNWHIDGPPTLMQNLGGMTFASAAVPWIMPMDRHSCAWGEANGDGSPDLFCGQGANHGTGEGHKELWSSNPWTEWATAAGVDEAFARSRSVNWLDYDLDGDLDLFAGAAERVGFGDQLYRNDRGSFTPVWAGISAERNTQLSTWADWNHDRYPDLLLIQPGYGSNLRAFVNRAGTYQRVSIGHSGGTWKSAAWGDYDGDGWPDLSLIGQARSLILHNVRGTFSPVHDVAISRGQSSVWLDLDNDGLLDLYVVRTAPGLTPGSGGDAADKVLVQTKKGSFRKLDLPETGGWAGAGDSAAAADVDGDHRVDVLVSNGHVKWVGHQQLLVNRTPAGNGGTLQLAGTRWNPMGFGARVRVAIGSTVRWLAVTDGVAGHSQSTAILNIGMGTATSAQVRVMWSNGGCDRVTLRAQTRVVLAIRSRPC
jgi:hypothetical protein